MKAKRAQLFIFNYLFFTTHTIQSISIVYNIKIAETTKHHTFEKDITHAMLVGVTPFNQFRNRYNSTREFAVGALVTALYYTKKFYVRADCAGARVGQEKDGTCFHQTQSDDILFSAGYTQRPHKQLAITFSGLLGIPTHKDLSLQHIQCGYGHIGVGAQVDGAFRYSNSSHNTIRAAARLIHFIPRRAPYMIEHKQKSVDFHIGNLADLFISHYLSTEKQRVEYGYNLTALFGTRTHPTIENIIKGGQFIKSSFFGTYEHLFSFFTLPSSLLLGLSYGFDHQPKIIGQKRVITLWATWSMRY